MSEGKRVRHATFALHHWAPPLTRLLSLTRGQTTGLRDATFASQWAPPLTRLLSLADNRRIKVLQERLDVTERKYQNQRHLTHAAQLSLARSVESSVAAKAKAATSEAMMSRVKEASEAGVRNRTMERLKESLHQSALEIESCRQKIRDAQSDPLLLLPIGGALRRELERVKRRYHALVTREESERAPLGDLVALWWVRCGLSHSLDRLAPPPDPPRLSLP